MSGGELPVVDATPGLPQVPRPVLLVVNEEPALAREVETALRGQFGPQGFDALCVDSATTALDLIRGLRDSGGQLALLLVDQEIASGGTRLVAEGRELFRRARTVLLIPHAEMPAAVEARNAGVLDHWLVKPLQHYEQQLIPIVDDLLGDWRRWADEQARAVRVIGHRDSPDTGVLREFLRRNDIHYEFFDIDQGQAARALLRGAPTDPESLPVALLEGGMQLRRPSPRELANALGLRTHPQDTEYDLTIIGAGPAGLAAAVYGASEGLRTVVIERESPGGQAGTSSKIENYLGFPSGLSGGELAQRALQQSHSFGAEIVRLTEAVALEADGSNRVVRLSEGAELRSRVVLIACGVAYRRLDVPGLDALVGRGVRYGAAMSEAREFEGKHVCIVGGANSAGQAALHFSEYARQVTLLIRGASIEKGMSTYLTDRIAERGNVEVRTGTEVRGVAGEVRLTGLRLGAAGGSGSEAVEADGLFIFIGAVPHTDWLAETVAREEAGFLLAGPDIGTDPASGPGSPADRDPLPLETSLPGVFVAGDVRRGSVKRVASAVGEGAMAVQLIHRYLAEQVPAGARP
jgi:thioredoxin reductase (NADPH)